MAALIFPRFDQMCDEKTFARHGGPLPLRQAPRDSSREALKALVRALARADAIEDYRRRNGDLEGATAGESSNLRPV